MFSLTAGPATVEIAPEAGGRIGSMQLEQTELLVTSDPSPMGWGLFPMVPFAGRIRDGRFTFRGRTVELPRNLPPNAIHGTVLEREWEVAADRMMSITLEQPWPFGGSATHTVDLAPDGLRLRLEVEATDEAFPCVVGWHPWFRRPATVTFAAGAMYERGDDGLPTGKLVPPADGPWDDCFTELHGPVTIDVPGWTLTMTSSADHLVVFDRLGHAVCAEPQTGPPDAHNLGRAQVVSPGRPLGAEMRIGWARSEGAAARGAGRLRTR